MQQANGWHGYSVRWCLAAAFYRLIDERAKISVRGSTTSSALWCSSKHVLLLSDHNSSKNSTTAVKDETHHVQSRAAATTHLWSAALAVLFPSSQDSLTWSQFVPKCCSALSIRSMVATTKKPNRNTFGKGDRWATWGARELCSDTPRHDWRSTQDLTAPYHGATTEKGWNMEKRY
jgi:hypothetical protein